METINSINNKSSSKLPKSVREEKKLCLAFAVYCTCFSVNFCLKEMLAPENNSLRGIINYAVFSIFGFFFISVLPIVLRRRFRMFLTAYFVAIVIYVVSYFSSAYPIFYSEKFFYIFIMNIPALVLFSAIKDHQYFLKYLYPMCIFQVILSFSLFLSRIQSSGYDSSTGFYTLLSTAVLFNALFDEKTKHKYLTFLFFFVGFLIIATRGQRGQIFSLVIYVFLRILFSNYAYKKQLVIAVVIMSAVLFIFSSTLIDNLIELLRVNNIYSRTIYLLGDGRFITYTSGRDKLYENALDLIYERPLTGYGLYASEVYLKGAYPHNLFLDYLLVFGEFIGGLATICISTFTAAILLSKNSPLKELGLLFFATAIFPMMTSGTFITSPMHLIYYAIGFRLIASRKKVDLPSIHSADNIEMNAAQQKPSNLTLIPVSGKSEP